MRIYQDGLEVSDSTYLKNLDQDIVLRVFEEPLPTAPSSPMVRFEEPLPTAPISPMVRDTVNQSIVGNMMAQDPNIPCSSSNEGPYLLPFLVSEEEHSAILLNLTGDPLVISSSRS